MSAEPRPEPAGAGPPDHAPMPEFAWSSSPPDASAEPPPSEQRAAAPWAQAADPSGALNATKATPEPDSLGG